MTLKTAQNAHPIYACIDDSTYQSAVCEASGRLAQEMGLPIHLFHVIDIEDNDHKKKHSDNPAESGEESIIKKLLHLEEGLATVEDEDKATLLDSLHRKMNAEYLVKVDYEQLQGDFEEHLLAAQPQMGWLVMGKSGKTNEGNAEKIGTHTLNIVKQLTVPTMLVNTPYRLMSDILIAVTGRQADIDWLQRIITEPNGSHWLKDKNVHLVMINPDPMHPNHQESPVIVNDSDINQAVTQDITHAEPQIVAGVEVSASAENNTIETTIESALDKIKALAKDVTQSIQEVLTDSKAEAESSHLNEVSNSQTAIPTVAWDLVSFQKATSDWEQQIVNLHRQVVFQSDLVNVILGYMRDNRINGIILPALSSTKDIASQAITQPQTLANQDAQNTTTPELIEMLLKESYANLILLP